MIRSSTRGVCRLYSRCFYDIYYGFASLLANPSFIPLEEKARAPGARQAPGGPVAFDGFIAPGGPVEFVGFIAPGGPGALDGSLGSGVVVSSWTFVSTKTISPARRGPRLGCLYRRSRYGRPAGGLGSVFCIYEDDMAGTPGATPPSPLFNPRRPPPRPFDLGGRCRFFVEGAIRRRRRGIQGGRGPGGRGAPVSGARDFSLCQPPRTAPHLRVYEECIECVPCSWGATSGRAQRARAPAPPEERPTVSSSVGFASCAGESILLPGIDSVSEPPGEPCVRVYQLYANGYLACGWVGDGSILLLPRAQD